MRLLIEEVHVAGSHVQIQLRIPLDPPDPGPRPGNPGPNTSGPRSVSSKDRLRSLRGPQRRLLPAPKPGPRPGPRSHQRRAMTTKGVSFNRRQGSILERRRDSPKARPTYRIRNYRAMLRPCWARIVGHPATSAASISKSRWLCHGRRWVRTSSLAPDRAARRPASPAVRWPVIGPSASKPEASASSTRQLRASSSRAAQGSLSAV